MASAGSKGLSLGGQVFFGSLCVGTFGLGTWQTSRYFQKVEMIAEREKDLSEEPRSDFAIQEESDKFRPLRLQGRYDHTREFLVGPRGPPPGALPDSGAISMSPQGYFVITPMKLDRTGEILLVNRGWVPRGMVVPEGGRGRPNNGSSDLLQWSRPRQNQQVVAVPAAPEKPKTFLVAQHNLTERPPRLFWYDKVAMQVAGGIPMDYTTLLVTAVRGEEEKPQLPLCPPLDRVGDFKVTPAVHAGYATTWYGLSLAGVYMTRIMLRR